MSSCPGLTLEDYLRWNYNVTVEDTADANASLQIAEFLGTAVRIRPTLTLEQFKPLVAMFEEYREQVESLLDDFDEETQSWRDYASCCFDFIPEKVYDAGSEMMKGYHNAR